MEFLSSPCRDGVFLFLLDGVWMANWRAGVDLETFFGLVFGILFRILGLVVVVGVVLLWWKG